MSFKSLVKYLAVACLVVVIAIQALILGLHLIVESQIKSRLPANLRAFQPDFSIRAMGPGRTILREVRLGEDLFADLIELRYRWKGGKDFQVEKFIISGLSLAVTLENSDGARRIRFNHMVFPNEGIDKNKGNDVPPDPISIESLKKISPLIPGQVRVKHAKITLRRKEGNLVVPAGIMVHLDPEGGRGNLRITLAPLGQHINLAASVDLKKLLNREPDSALEQIEVGMTGFNPGCLASLLPEVYQALYAGGLNLAGPVDLQIHRQGQGPWRADIKGGRIRKGNLPEIGIEWVKGQLTLADGFSFKGTGRVGVRDAAFFPAWMDWDLAAEIHGDNGTENGSEFKLSLSHTNKNEMILFPARAGWLCPSKGLPEKIRIAGPNISAVVTGDMDQQNCRMDFSGQGVGVSLPAGSVTTKNVTLGAYLDRRKDGAFPIVSGSVDMVVKGMVTASDRHRLASPAAVFKTQIQADKKKGRLVCDLESRISKIKGRWDGTAVFTNRAGISGTVRLDKAYKPSVAVTALLNNLTIAMADKKIKANGISVKLPWTYPFRSGTGAGRVNISRLSYDKRLSASLAGRIKQTGEHTLAVTGNIATPLVPDLTLGLAVTAGVDDTQDPWAEVNLDTENFLLTGEDISRIMPTADIPGTFQIDLSPSVRIQFKNKTLNTGALIRIHDGSLDFPDSGVTAAGLSGEIRFNDLLVPESLPGQTLFVKSVTAGQFSFDDLGLRFSIEDGRFLNVENLTFNWCNGLVSTESLRLSGEDDKLKLTLYCDRLELESLLQQIGAFDAQGGGTLSGRIPVVYNNGEIAFDNGFLFSTPGQGGRIFVKDLDRMLDGFPKGTPEFSQLDLAGEALKDFEYKWAKLRLNTHGDTLDVKMELDGKPTHVLPFEYKKEMNSFMRVDASSPGSRFQGIKLDANLKLPFNRVMKFGTKLRSILE